MTVSSDARDDMSAFARSFRVHPAFALALTLASAEASGADIAGTTSFGADEEQAFGAGHGTVSIATQDLYSRGDYDGPAGSASGNVRFLSAQIDATYFVADHWELHASIPPRRLFTCSNP